MSEHIIWHTKPCSVPGHCLLIGPPTDLHEFSVQMPIETAELIVRACNEYHDLIEQRKDLVDAGNNALGVFVGYVEGSIGGQAIKQLETAIAKTKEN